MKDLPALVQREVSRALVIAGSTIEHDMSGKQYLTQVSRLRVLGTSVCCQRDVCIGEHAMAKPARQFEHVMQISSLHREYRNICIARPKSGWLYHSYGEVSTLEKS